MSVSRDQRHSKAHRCPVCGGADQDPRDAGKRCFGFTSEDGEWCHCSREDFAGGLDVDAAGTYTHKMTGSCRCGTTHREDMRPRDEIEKTYDYCTADGALVYQVVRKTGKRFLQRKPDGAGGWNWKLNGTPRTLYRLVDLFTDDQNRDVFVVEGEKDADTLAKLGFLATCNAGGAGKWHTVLDVAKTALAGRNLIVIADNDAPGLKHAAQVRAAMTGVAASVRVVQCIAPYKDVTDLVIAKGHLHPNDLVDLAVDSTPPPNDEAFDESPPEPDPDWFEMTSHDNEPAKAPIRVLGIAEICAPLPSLDYLCDGLALVAGGGAPHLVAGYGFSGKTMAIQSMLVALAAGVPIFGVHPCRARRVVHVDLEQGERLDRARYQRLMWAMGATQNDIGDRLLLAPMPPLSLTLEHTDAWRSLMKDRDLLVIDSLKAATSGVDENDSGIRASLDMLGRLSEETGCRVLVIHHARKPGADESNGGRFSIRGSSAIFDACDGVYVFSGEKGEPVKVEMVKARSHGEAIEDFALTIADVELDGDPRAGVVVRVHGAELIAKRRDEASKKARTEQLHRDAEELHALISKRPGMNTRELRASAGMGRDRIEAALSSLKVRVTTLDKKEGRTWVKLHYPQEVIT